MHLGGLLSTQEARVAIASCTSYASFVLSNLPRASITRWLHSACLLFLNSQNVLLFSCNPIGQLCQGGPSFSGRNVKQVIIKHKYSKFLIVTA